MIPKKIHYCWFGKGEKPKMAQKCIASWKKHMPDYEIIEWNEDNFDINKNPYTKMCYEQSRFAFLTDYLRLLIIEEHGGIYFDTDVEVIKNFDALLSNKAFIGFENNQFVNTGEGFGAEAHASIVQTMLKEYDVLLDGNHGTIGCPILNTQALEKHGLIKNGTCQILEDVKVLPAEYLNPRDSITGELSITPNTYSIHWYAASWMPWHIRLRALLGRAFRRLKKRVKKHA